METSFKSYSGIAKRGFWDALQNLPPQEKHSSLKNWEEYFLGYEIGEKIREKEKAADCPIVRIAI